MTSLRHHRRLCIDIGRRILASRPAHALDELAVPAYTKGNALSRWLFWQRVSCCHRLVLRYRGGSCLDFGCGMGVMLPLLQESFEQVYAVEIEDRETRAFMDEWEQTAGQLPASIRLSRDLDSAEIPESSLRVILAMDVFEHIDDLPPLLERLEALLAEDGVMLVTGPTENWLYRLGRRAVGFSGDYHRRNIVDIMGEMERFFSVTLVRRLIFPFTLFLVLRAERRLGLSRSR